MVLTKEFFHFLFMIHKKGVALSYITESYFPFGSYWLMKMQYSFFLLCVKDSSDGTRGINEWQIGGDVQLAGV